MFSPKELESIRKDRIFTKSINNKKYWIKPLFEYQSYSLGNHQNHRRYFKILNKYFDKHMPKTKFEKFNLNGKEILLIIQEDVKGRRINTLKELKHYVDLKKNRKFKIGLKKLLENKSLVIDLYVYKGNFVRTGDGFLIYIDSRMPVFVDPSEERYNVSKKRTLKLLK